MVKIIFNTSGALKGGYFLLFFMFLISSTATASQVIRNIPYTHDGKQFLDLFLPWDAGIDEIISHPAAIIMHAGGWSSGNREEVEYIAAWFAKQGFVVINVDYSLAPNNKWPVQLFDVIEGVWWLKKNAVRYNINPNKILAVGASAGGHLAAMLGQNSVTSPTLGVDSEVHGIISFSGPWNLLAATTEVQNKIIKQFLPLDTIVARTMASPLYHINRHSPPVLLFHGTKDKLVPFRQAQQACNAYAFKKLQYCFLVPLEGQDHFVLLNKTIIDNSLHAFLTWWFSI